MLYQLGDWRCTTATWHSCYSTDWCREGASLDAIVLVVPCINLCKRNWLHKLSSPAAPGLPVEAGLRADHEYRKHRRSVYQLWRLLSPQELIWACNRSMPQSELKTLLLLNYAVGYAATTKDIGRIPWPCTCVAAELDGNAYTITCIHGEQI